MCKADVSHIKIVYNYSKIVFLIYRNRAVCPDRHQINLQMDVPQNTPDKIIQTPGFVTVSVTDLGSGYQEYRSYIATQHITFLLH